MTKLMMLGLALALTNGAAAAEKPLSIKLLKIERAESHSYILFQVDNTSEHRFEATTWSCVFFVKQQPVHEERNLIENVPPHGRAIKREIQAYGGPYDSVECRFLSSRPSACGG